MTNSREFKLTPPPEKPKRGRGKKTTPEITMLEEEGFSHKKALALVRREEAARKRASEAFEKAWREGKLKQAELFPKALEEMRQKTKAEKRDVLEGLREALEAHEKLIKAQATGKLLPEKRAELLGTIAYTVTPWPSNLSKMVLRKEISPNELHALALKFAGRRRFDGKAFLDTYKLLLKAGVERHDELIKRLAMQAGKQGNR